ncbi:tetratricopeptide repeat protein [Nonlabens ulvanivorans]|uniref:tetratricopeptide repeat protein n=1 Tax=Nonlabens ulvanivorans TaxID=906888 RepID=UPI0029432620|nr:tetratricopeptide repeat protein [Nonlabens ulvanivorans]WOI23943.1 tetratricopeptide repeat protein [Nonlabens ulvanivorans]
MKIRLTILFLAIAALGFAQKREFRKIENAITKGDLPEAIEIFSTINESEVEEEYKGQYSFYKAASLIDVTGETKPTLETAYAALDAMNKAESLGYSNPALMGQVKKYINDSLLQIANKKLNSKDNSGALEIVNKLSSESPQDLNMLYNAANLAYQVGEFEQAEEQYLKLFNKGFTGEVITYTAVNKLTKVEESFPNLTLRDVSVKTGSHVSPSESKSPSQLGRIVTNLVWLQKNNGDMASAKATFSKALKLYGNDESLKISKADNYLTLGMMKEYEEANKALSDEVKDPKVYDNLALAAINAKEYDQAIKYYEKSLSMKPDNFISLSNLGVAYVQKGNLETTSAADQQTLYNKAIQVYEKAHNLDSSNKNIINTLISLYGVFSMEDKITAMKAKL